MPPIPAGRGTTTAWQQCPRQPFQGRSDRPRTPWSAPAAAAFLPMERVPRRRLARASRAPPAVSGAWSGVAPAAPAPAASQPHRGARAGLPRRPAGQPGRSERSQRSSRWGSPLRRVRQRLWRVQATGPAEHGAPGAPAPPPAPASRQPGGAATVPSSEHRQDAVSVGPDGEPPSPPPGQQVVDGRGSNTAGPEAPPTTLTVQAVEISGRVGPDDDRRHRLSASEATMTMIRVPGGEERGELAIVRPAPVDARAAGGLTVPSSITARPRTSAFGDDDGTAVGSGRRRLPQRGHPLPPAGRSRRHLTFPSEKLPRRRHVLRPGP